MKKERILSMLMSLAMILSIFAGVGIGQTQEVQAAVKLRNPWKDADGSTVWDCVYFGNYWQNDTNGDGKADRKDKKESIRWRVLSVDDEEIFLLADAALDCQQFNTKFKAVAWEKCTLRKWLNGKFLGDAFSAAEKADIKKTRLVNADNPSYETAGGRDTVDKVFLLSIEDACNPAYGFRKKFDCKDKARKADFTEYAGTARDLNVGTCGWWLRSPGNNTRSAASVLPKGFGSLDGDTVDYIEDTVRPALRLKRSSTRFSYAGTANSAGKQSAKKKGTAITPKGSTHTYKVTASGKKPTVAFTKADAESKSVTIPATIKDENGTTYQVTSIGKNAFSGCTKLKAVVISGTKLKSIGKNAFKGIKSSAEVKVPKSRKKAYQTLLKDAGFKGAVRT